ncbi:aspartate/methionine/tyrosine aminotransferase [Hasllibacter halocynthiae]|uniref:Aspartate/methionine/tyrosine aminotransferase n=1 Tax=Hasllibacter halocynthiae TaxID=595589 RepID=A0A2T0X1E5_9RHOB|nr:aminotransferase class I/II-fold pyridoxal phosphate-dependent enzyme [Hasllibacter halocynthiae]PRY92768.1 aspartate/methionine/tyrosine aminotransferase [Hasllibacter halocynthiae]
MDYPERFENLPAYAFPRLRALLDGIEPGRDPVAMSIGEPRHASPDWVGPMLAEKAAGFAKYPPNPGPPALLDAVAAWIARRYGAEVGTDRLMALNGSREGLFAVSMALVPERKAGAAPTVLVPNPFYQVYAVGALAAAAEPVFLPCTEGTGNLPDLDAIPRDALDRCALFFLCSPSNPQGAVAPMGYLRRLAALAERHDFRVVCDECYSEIWRDAPPPGILQAGADPERVVAIHSLSKRSNLPGLRSGFAVAGPETMRRLRRLRDYAGAPLPGPIAEVSARLWGDEAHVEASRARYQAKFALADRIMEGIARSPEGGFFLWLPVPGGDAEAAVRRLWAEEGVLGLPGNFLAREAGGETPGRGHVRLALVAGEDELEDGLGRVRRCLWK